MTDASRALQSSNDDLPEGGIVQRYIRSARQWAHQILADRTQKISDKQISIAAIKVYCLKLGGAGLAYAMQVALAQLLGVSNYGVFALSWVLAATLGQICCCGFNETANRFLPGYLSVNDLPRARGFLWFARRITLFTATAVAIGVALGVVLAQSWINEVYILPVLLGVLSVPILAYTHLHESVAISRSHMLAGLTSTYILRPLFLIVLTALFVLVWHMESATTAMIAFLVAGAMAALLQFVFLSPVIRSEIGKGEMVVEKRFWLVSSLPLFMSQGFFILATSVDVLVLSYFVVPGDLGIYFAAAKTVGVLSFIYVAVGLSITRRLSEASAADDAAAFRQHFNRGRKWMLLPTVVGAVLLLLVAPLLLRIFGAEFVSGTTIVAILLSGVVAQAAGGPLQEALVVTGHQNSVSLIVAMSMLANLLLNVLLIMWLGIAGAAIASSICVMARVAAMWLTASRKLPQVI